MKNIKITFSFLVAIAVIAMAPSAAFALDASSAGSTAGTVAASPSPSLSPQSAGTSAGTATLDSQSAGTSASTATLNAQSAGTSAGTATLNSQSAGTSAGTATLNAQSAGTSAGTETTTGNGGTSGGNTGGGSGGGSGFVSSGGGSVVLPFGSCELIGTHMTLGGNNSVVEVTELQNFLKNTEGIPVAVTGVYDAQTVEAVKAFQIKYASEILAPWGISNPTGHVYMTTLKKINNRACNTPLTLNATQLAEINAYKARGISNVSTPLVGQADGTGLTGTVVTNTDSPFAGTTSDESQVAAAGDISVWSKIWNFIRRIFGR